MDALVHGDFGLGEAGGECLCGGGLGDGYTLVQIAGIGQTYTVSPTLLHRRHVRLDAVRPGRGAARPRQPTSDWTCWASPAPTARIRAKAACRRCTLSGYSALGNPGGWSPLYRNDQSYTFNTNASWIEGRARHPVRLRLRAPPDEPLAAGAGRRPARRLPFRSRRDGLEPRGARRTAGSRATRRRSRTTGTAWPASCWARPPRRARAASSSR